MAAPPGLRQNMLLHCLLLGAPAAAGGQATVWNSSRHPGCLPSVYACIWFSDMLEYWNFAVGGLVMASTAKQFRVTNVISLVWRAAVRCGFSAADAVDLTLATTGVCAAFFVTPSRGGKNLQ